MEIKREIDKNGGKFFIEKDSRQVAELVFNIDGNIIDAHHTGVLPELEGQGVAAKLFDEMVKYAREKGYKVNPSCSYIHAKFRRNPEKFSDIWSSTNESE